MIIIGTTEEIEELNRHSARPMELASLMVEIEEPIKGRKRTLKLVKDRRGLTGHIPFADLRHEISLKCRGKI